MPLSPGTADQQPELQLASEYGVLGSVLGVVAVRTPPRTSMSKMHWQGLRQDVSRSVAKHAVRI